MNSIEQATFIGGLRRGKMAADHFTIISNAVARDPAISYRAKGIFANLSSHQRGFTITQEFLASMGTEGVKAIRAALDELRAAGYVYRGPRMRHPKGTVNDKGKDISGSLGSYTWYVTDKPEEIAAILERYAAEQQLQAQSEADETAGHDKVPERQLVLTSDNSEEVSADSDIPLGAISAGSDDQGKHPKSPAQHQLPKPPVGFGSSLEDHHQKTNQEDQPGWSPCVVPSPCVLWIPRPSVRHQGDEREAPETGPEARTTPAGEPAPADGRTDRESQDDGWTPLLTEQEVVSALRSLDFRKSQARELDRHVAAETARVGIDRIRGYLLTTCREARTATYVITGMSSPDYAEDREAASPMRHKDQRDTDRAEQALKAGANPEQSPATRRKRTEDQQRTAANRGRGAPAHLRAETGVFLPSRYRTAQKQAS